MLFKGIIWALLLSTALVTAQSRDRNKKKYKVVCYLGSWANYRQEDAKFLIEHIDPHLCTHLIYGFAKLNNNKIVSYDPYLDLTDNWGLGAFHRFNKLKQVNPELSTLIAIGGWNEGSTKYSQMAANTASREEFVKSAVDFCLKYDFDGLDMDWEYPANRGGVSADKQNFVMLLKELKEAFETHGLILSAAVSAGKATIDTAYDIPGVAKYLDFINVMAYDLHGFWEQQTGHNAPLHARPDSSEAEKVLTVDFAINYWIKNGAPKNKIILGMGLYGRSFTLADAYRTGLGSPTTGPGKAGHMTKEPGMLGYNEICLNIKNNGWNKVFVDKVEAPYAFHDRQWVGYDNKRSVEIKADYVIKNQLGGGMVWSLETDDFRGRCFAEKYPLLTAISHRLNGPVVKPTVSPQTTLQPKPTADPGVGFRCTAEGYFPDPDDCEVFYYCARVGGEFAKNTYHCGEGAAFDETTSTCTFRYMVPRCK